MDVDQLFSYLTAKGIPHEVAAILRGKNCLRTFTFLVLDVVCVLLNLTSGFTTLHDTQAAVSLGCINGCITLCTCKCKLLYEDSRH
jgi:hypothetical protein